MRPNLQYVLDKFDYYNQLCFNGELKRPPISLNTRYGSMGITRYQQQTDSEGNTIFCDCSIEISVRHDVPEEEYIDTIVHEMIHYYIFSNNIHDDSPHGTIFQAKAREIKEKYGIRVTVAYEPTEEALIAKEDRQRIILVIQDKDDKMYFGVVIKNMIFKIWDALLKNDQNTTMKWFVSNRAIFGKFPTTTSPTLTYIDADKLHHYLTGAHELTREGDVIKIKND